MKFKVLFSLLVLFSIYSFKLNTPPSYFVQFKINASLTAKEATEIDSKMRNKSMIQISRTDYITNTYFCIIKPDNKFSIDNFENWFKKLGYEISCYRSGIQGKDKSISPHILKNCTDEK